LVKSQKETITTESTGCWPEA